MISEKVLNETNSLSEFFMIQKSIRVPETLHLKILSEIQSKISTVCRPDQKKSIALLTVYTERDIFEGKMTGKNVNEQLSWNQDSLSKITECLSGKKPGEVRLEPLSEKHGETQGDWFSFEMICEIKSGINLSLFRVRLLRVPDKKVSPFAHMRQKFKKIDKEMKSVEEGLRVQEEKVRAEISEVEALEKQVVNSTAIEIETMKQNFIKIINQCKQETRKYLGKVNRNLHGDVITMARVDKESDFEQPHEEEEDRTLTNKSLRRIVEVRRNHSEVSSQNSAMELQQQSRGGHPCKDGSEASRASQPEPVVRKRTMHDRVARGHSESSSGDEQLGDSELQLFEKHGIYSASKKGSDSKRTFLEEQQELMKANQFANDSDNAHGATIGLLKERQPRNTESWDKLLFD